MQLDNLLTGLFAVAAVPAASQGFAPKQPQRLSPSSAPLTVQKVKPLRSPTVGRHGAVSNSAVGPESSDGIMSQSDGPHRGMSIALAASYFTVMGAKCALPAVLSLLMSPKTGLTFSSSLGNAQLAFSRLLFLSTIAVATGKLLLGPVIDHFGGILSLKVALASLAGLLGIISFSQSFTIFAAAWILVDFIFSSCWAACINAIHQSFPKNEWPGHVANLAAAARTGNAAAFALFAYLLHHLESSIKQPWRIVFRVSSAVQLIPVLLLSFCGRPALSQTVGSVSIVPKKPSFRASVATLRNEASRLDFWLHLLSRSVLMVYASFLLFVPKLMTDAYHMSAAVGSQVGSVYALGCLLSVSTGSQFYARLGRKGQLRANIVLLGTAICSSMAQLAHMSGYWNLSPEASALSMFTWGLAFAIPFYIPPSLYALARGGTKSSATIADVFDVAGFGLLAVFNGYVGSISHSTPAAWIPTFRITTTCAAISLLALSLTGLREKDDE